MEKFIISRLISIVLVFMPTFAFAQDDEPAIKIKTETYDGGITVDTYEKGSKQYRHIKKKNGDYFIEFMDMNYPIRWTLKDGTLIEGNCKELRINLYGKGDVLIASGLIDQKDFTNAEKTTPELFEGLNFKGFIRPNEPDKILPFSSEAFIGNKYHKESFLTLANCLYTIDNNGKMKFIGKKSKMKSGSDNEYAYVYAIPTDSIIDCEKMKDKKGYDIIKISYANGDEVFCRYGGLREGTHIHRENGVLKVKEADNDYCLYYFYFNDGRIFKGKMNNCFKEIYDPHYWESGDMTSKVLCYPSLTPYTGMLINKDNTGIVIENGMTQEEIEKQKELARKKEEANKKAGYNILCKTYGKKYVDAAMNGKVIVGMPVDLFLLGYPNTRLRQQSRGTKVYEVRNILNRITKVVRVSNGRVSGVTNY